jgi:hypothetical protein
MKGYSKNDAMFDSLKLRWYCTNRVLPYWFARRFQKTLPERKEYLSYDKGQSKKILGRQPRRVMKSDESGKERWKHGKDE